MNIEFALLYENRTWSTTIIDVPFDEDTQLTKIEEWAREQLQSESFRARHPFRDAILVCIYNDSPEES